MHAVLAVLSPECLVYTTRPSFRLAGLLAAVGEQIANIHRLLGMAQGTSWDGMPCRDEAEAGRRSLRNCIWLSCGRGWVQGWCSSRPVNASVGSDLCGGAFHYIPKVLVVMLVDELPGIGDDG